MTDQRDTPRASGSDPTLGRTSVHPMSSDTRTPSAEGCDHDRHQSVRDSADASDVRWGHISGDFGVTPWEPCPEPAPLGDATTGAEPTEEAWETCSKCGCAHWLPWCQEKDWAYRAAPHVHEWHEEDEAVVMCSRCGEERLKSALSAPAPADRDALGTWTAAEIERINDRALARALSLAQPGEITADQGERAAAAILRLHAALGDLTRENERLRAEAESLRTWGPQGQTDAEAAYLAMENRYGRADADRMRAEDARDDLRRQVAELTRVATGADVLAALDTASE